MPRNYLTVLEAIRESGSGVHLTAQDVFSRARAKQRHLGFATVHRALARLDELGYIRKVDVPGATSAVYEPSSAAHSHFFCTACGAIADVAFSLPATLLADLADRHGVEIAFESTTFAGRCGACRSAADATAEPSAPVR